MSITVYFSSAGGSREVKDQQSEIFRFLDSKKIKYFVKDITQSPDLKDEMRQKVGNPKAMPPQVFNGNKYCGINTKDVLKTEKEPVWKDADYQAFFNAVEDGKPETFFKL